MLVELTLIAGAVCFVFALMDERYGAIASDPSMWLNKGIIDGDGSALPRMLAYITYYHQERIDISVESNNAKATHIRRGILLGVATPILSGALLLLPIERWLNSLLH